jgi:uncharacterized protein
MMIRKIVLGSLFMLTVQVQAAPELKGRPEELKSFLYPTKQIVTIRSSAKEKAYSDKAIISIVITTEEDKLADSVKKNGELRANIFQSLIDSGIKKEDINTSKFSTSPQYGWFGKEPDSYEVVNRMAINIFNENQLNAIATISDTNKEVTLSDTEFEHTSKDELEEKVKKKALAKVMGQKTFYEETLGLNLKPVAFRDFDVVQSGSRGAQAIEQRITITGSRIKRTDVKPMSPPIMTTQSFDEVEYSATISVDFEIVNEK